MNGMTFRNSKIVYYGPHECNLCGVNICKMGAEFGGNAFTYPEGPIYPNTEWYVHVCDPAIIELFKGKKAKECVLKTFPDAHLIEWDDCFHIVRHPNTNLSGFHKTEASAWIDADELKHKTKKEALKTKVDEMLKKNAANRNKILETKQRVENL